MAIIKHLKRLGKTIRGARIDDLAVFNKDGDIVGANRQPKYMPTAPGNSNVGKVWTAKTNASVGWENIPNELPAIAEGDEGKILAVSDQKEPQWKGLYIHVIRFTATNADPDINAAAGVFQIVTSSPTMITSETFSALDPFTAIASGRFYGVGLDTSSTGIIHNVKKITAGISCNYTATGAYANTNKSFTIINIIADDVTQII